MPAADQRSQGQVHDTRLADKSGRDTGACFTQFYTQSFDLGDKIGVVGHDIPPHELYSCIRTDKPISPNGKNNDHTKDCYSVGRKPR